MPRTLCKSDKPLYLNIFPNWSGRQPARFFMMENLLEARSGSGFPTNGAGPDEDVNVFLAGLLTDFLQGHHDSQVVAGAGSLLQPPDPSLSRRKQAEFYIANANHRLVYLGLMNRGDGLRRRRVPFGLDESETRLRDLGVGRCCYQMAANLLQGRRLVSDGVVEVLEKLAANFTDYIQVLTVMATRQLGLGARLSDNDLAGLFDESDAVIQKEYPPRELPPGHPDMDQLLDLMLQLSENPDAQLELKLRGVARRVGADAEKILSGLCRT